MEKITYAEPLAQARALDEQLAPIIDDARALLSGEALAERTPADSSDSAMPEALCEQD